MISQCIQLMLTKFKHADMLGAEFGCQSDGKTGSLFHLTVPFEVAPQHASSSVNATRSNFSKDMGLVVSATQGFENFKTIADAPVGDILEENTKPVYEGKNILLVEDNWAHQVVTEKKLARLGCNCMIAVNGKNAIQLLLEGTFVPDVILMDLQMPIMVSRQVIDISNTY